MTAPMDKHEPVAAHIILNIDDHDASRYVKSRILRSAGYHVIESRTGQDALSLAREVKPQLALLDVNLPDIDGFDLCRRLKHDPVTASIMVLLVSAVRVRNEDKVVGLEGGADAYLIEPVDPDELLATVKALIRLHRSEQRLHLALDIAELGSYSWDSSTGTLSCDARIKRMLGLPADAFVDYDVLMKAVHPDDRTKMQTHLAKTFDQTGDGVYDMEFRIIGLEDGIERWVAARGQTWLNDSQLAGFTGTALEISKRKGTELDLARLKDELQTIFDSAPVMIWYKDTQNRILRVNQLAAESVGQPKASIEGRPVADLYPLEADRYYQGDLCVIETGLPKLGIIEPYRLPSGEERWIQTDRVPLKDGRGAVTGVLVLAVDITDRKKAEERLTNWNQDLEWAVCERTQELVASQDRLRTLTTELNLVEQRERKRLATELHDYLAQLLVVAKLKLAQGRHKSDVSSASAALMAETEEVISEALTYTRTLVADLSPTVLHQFGLPAALTWLGENMLRNELTVAVHLDEHGDLKLPEEQALLLFQSVRELLMNVAKHAKTGHASVNMACESDQLRIEVADEGAGFNLAPSDDEAASFDTSKFGLFSIRERMRALGGRLDLSSAPDKGTRATLILPLGASGRMDLSGLKSGVLRDDRRTQPFMKTTADRSVPDSRHAGFQQRAKFRVLLVDDHAMVRQGLRSLLDGYRDLEVVGEAWNGEQANALVELLRPTHVVMDVNMPKMNGIQATARIKAAYPDTRVIGLSIQVDAESWKAMLDAGAEGLLTKEAAVEQLYQMIQGVSEDKAPREASIPAPSSLE